MELKESNFIKRSPKHSHHVIDVPIAVEKEMTYLVSLWKESGKLIGKIDDRFCNAQNPYLYVLDLMCFDKDYRKSQLPSLVNSVCQEFKKWLKNNETASQYLTLDIKSLALDRIANIESPSLIHLMCEIFELQKDIEFLKPIIDRYVAEKKYKQGCYVIISLNLQELYSFDEVLFPVLSLNYISIVHEYLEKHRDLQIQFVKEVDAICENEASVSRWMSSMNVPSSYKSGGCNLKSLQRVLSNFLKKYNVPLENCTNLVKKRSWGALNYIFHKFFIEKSMSEESWKEMILNEVFTTDQDIQRELLMKLLVYDRADMAIELTRILKISPENWPDALRLHLQNTPSNSSDIDDLDQSPMNHERESWIRPAAEEYLALPVDEKDIILIESISAFETCINDIALNYDVVGVDAEWRPTMGITEERVTVLQLATWDNVYLIDVLSLMEELNEDHFCLLMEKIFCNPQILKLGFGIHYDLEMLKILMKDTKAFYLKPASVLEFGDFFRHVCSLHGNIAKYFQDDERSRHLSFEENEKKGLSALCMKVLGKPLNKVEQFSDWRRRPMRKSQIIYAALDAHCLLQIFEKLFRVMGEHQLSLRDLIKAYFTHTGAKDKTKDKPKEKPKKQQQPPPPPEKEFDFPPKNVSLFRVVVDSSLAGLGRQLRLRGADVIILEEGLHPTELVKVSDKEDRVILSSAGRFERIRKYVPDNMVLNIPQSETAAEQVSLVCKHFNIICTVDDVLSRCMLCNCNKYLKVSSEDLQLLWTMKNTSPMSPKAKKSDLVPFIRCSEGFITEECLMQNGKEIQLSQLSSEVLLRGLMFFICSNCGKIYWEGCHHRRTQKSISDWIEEHESQKSSNDAVLHLVPCTSSPPESSSSPQESSSLSSSKDTSQTTKDASALVSYFESDEEDDYDYDIDDIVYS